MPSQWRLLVLSASVITVAVMGEDVLISEAEAVARLTENGAELALPGFKHDMSLLSFGFTDMSKLPSPAGALADNIKVVSTAPYVLVIDDFLSARECDFLRALGVERLKPAMVVESGDNWYNTQAQTRNNEQVWLTQPEEKGIPLLRHIMKRIHRTARTPDEYAEALQIGRYMPGQKYEGHIDSDPKHNVARPLTMLTYLNDVEEGGHTIFPLGRNDCNGIWRKHPKTGEDSYGAAICCETPELDKPQTVRVTPKKGRVVIFYSHLPDGSLDDRANHVGCPVVKGEKWIAQRWLRYEPYNRVNYAEGAGWDPRFDGVPKDEFRVSDREGAHMRVVSALRPKLYLEEHFLNKDEIQQLHSVAIQRQMKSTLPQPGEGHGPPMIFEKAELDANPILKTITARAHLFARLPAMNDVKMVVKRFALRQSEPTHMPASAITVMVYFHAVEEGGELMFPEFHKAKDENCNEDLAACCAKSKAKFRAQKGDAVLLFAHDQRGRSDRTTKYGHCPITKGEIWMAEWQFSFEPQVQGAPASKPMAQQPDVRFDNQRSTPVWIFWVDTKGGGETAMGEVAPQEVKSIKSFAGHIFTVKNEEGKVIDKVTVGASVMQRQIITEDNTATATEL